jgi:hypothetical protein
MLLPNLIWKDVVSRGKSYLKPMVLPVLVAVVPTLYHYSNNADKLTLLSLSRMLVFNIAIAAIMCLGMLAFFRSEPIKAANAAVIGLIFFNIYGLCYRYLLHLDIVRIKHYTFLPLVLLIAIYAILFSAKLNRSIAVAIWKNVSWVTGILTLLYVVLIVPVEVRKSQFHLTNAPVEQARQGVSEENLPDIYYIVLDEFVGFQAMREYWKYDGVDDFVDFLQDRGFFVAEESHSTSTDTLHQLASRLNYEEYPLGLDLQTYFAYIADNRVMRELRSRGYTIVVFDETNMPYASAQPIQADHLVEFGSDLIPERGRGQYGFAFDEFGELVMGNTMLSVFAGTYRQNPQISSQHSAMISYTVDNVASPNIPSPKFVYVHLMLPHFPFVFDQNGNIFDTDRVTDWNRYLDNYIYSIKVAQAMIENIFLAADADNPPVIILQSDHGARNQLTQRPGSTVLPDYPEEFKTLILNALYLPGYDQSRLSQDLDPMDTFPIIFDHLFDTGILQEEERRE